jgi:hypothetical protein
VRRGNALDPPYLGRVSGTQPGHSGNRAYRGAGDDGARRRGSGRGRRGNGRDDAGGWCGLNAQEPSSRGGYAGPGTVVNGRGGNLGGGSLRGWNLGGWGVVVTWRSRAVVVTSGGTVRQARARDDQARRNGPGGNKASRITSGRAHMLGFFRRREIFLTVLTRLVALCIHHRPQFVHFSGGCHSALIRTLTSW